jgi:glyoxylase I family protein
VANTFFAGMSQNCSSVIKTCLCLLPTMGFDDMAEFMPVPEGLSMMLRTKGFLHITIGVTDLDRATDFYQNVLGCELVRKNPIMSFMKTGDDFFVLTVTGTHVPPNPEGEPVLENTLFHHAMIIDNLAFEDVISELTSRGIATWDCSGTGQTTFPNRRHVYIKDPDGNSIELVTDPVPAIA